MVEPDATPIPRLELCWAEEGESALASTCGIHTAANMSAADGHYAIVWRRALSLSLSFTLTKLQGEKHERGREGERQRPLRRKLDFPLFSLISLWL
jgi:hypothetical protein